MVVGVEGFCDFEDVVIGKMFWWDFIRFIVEIVWDDFVCYEEDVFFEEFLDSMVTEDL